jgi:hypothetical protein
LSASEHLITPSAKVRQEREKTSVQRPYYRSGTFAPLVFGTNGAMGDECKKFDNTIKF